MNKVNFIVPVLKIFPSPLSKAATSVFLILNEAGDLSLYRKKEHVWSAGRFKTILNVEWSPDGKYFAVQGDKRYFLYSAEDGKRLAAINLDESCETTESSTCRWIKISDALILAVVDFKNFAVKWSVNCEFELKGGRLLLESSEPISGVRIDPKNNDILVTQSSSSSTTTKTTTPAVITRFKFPFDPQQDSSVLHISQLSKHLQTLLRVVDELRAQLMKLLKLNDSVFERISEIDAQLMKRYLLFGCSKDRKDDPNSGTNLFPELSETEVLEWKSKLKKQHAELLVSIEEVSSVLRTFQAAFPKFNSTEVDQFRFTALPEFEGKSRHLQHDLAEFLLWLEIMIIPDSNGTANKVIKAFTPDSRALSLAKNLQGSENRQYEDWCLPFADFKTKLDEEFKSLVSKINLVDLYPQSKLLHAASDTNEELLSNQLYSLDETTRRTLLV